MKCPSCGFPLTEHSRARSPQDHRRFFKLIHSTYHHWPEANAFTPDSAEHLRAFLLCKAGYRDVTMIPCPEYADAKTIQMISAAAAAALKASKSYAFIRPHAGGLAVFSPKSIAWDKLDQSGFNRIRDAVEAVIRDETGMEPDDILNHTEEAA